MRVTAIVRAALICAAAACSDSRGTDGVTQSLGDIQRTGRIADAALTEMSGLAPSLRQPGLFWSFNDSGHDARVFALDSAGVALGSLVVRGAANRDWEAMASGPCPEGACLYVGDVGDNGARRDVVTVWRVVEPRPDDDSTALAIPLRFRYPGGPRDVEAMWVSPDTSVWLVTKRPLRAGKKGALRPALLYRLPAASWNVADTAIASLVDSMPLVPVNGNSDTWITDAAFTMHGGIGRVAVRTYQEVVVLEADLTSGRPGAVRARCSLRALGERTGEAVAWLGGERLLLGNEGRGSRLASGRCPP